jgi:hypothetical protein
MNESSIVLRQDIRGRVITPVERRLAVVAEFERSGLPGTQFAKLAGVKYATLMNWVAKKRAKPAAGKPKRRTPLFAEAIVSRQPKAEPDPIIVEFNGGARLCLRSAAQIPLAAQLLNALQQ